MAPKPDGKAAKSERITFTRPAAERIAAVVRSVERGDRDTKGNTWGVRLEGGGGGGAVVFHIGTFTGAWATSAVKVVTFKYQTTTPNTASVTNLFFPYPENGTKDCAIAKDGTAWFLVDVPLVVATLQTATITYITGGTATLNTATCDIVFTPATATAVVLSVTTNTTYLTFKV